MSQRALILLVVVVTVLLLVSVEADLWSDHRSPRHYHYNSTLLSSLRIAHAGEIELDETSSRIVRMSPHALLDVYERQLLSRRRLQVRPDASGRPTYSFKVGARWRSAEEGRAYLADRMDDVVRSTTVGAEARARNLLRDWGVARLLDEVGGLRSNATRRIYLEAASRADGLRRDQAVDIIRTAGRELTSSSRLRETLTGLAETLPAAWGLAAPLAEAASEIASSSEKGDALRDIVRLRPIEPADAPAVAAAVSTIASTSERGRTITAIHRLAPSTELATALLESADGLESSSERRRVLTELVAAPRLSEAAWARALDVASGIASTADKAHALTALISSAEPTARGCREWLLSTGEVVSSSLSADLLVEAAVRCPNEDDVWRAYLRRTERLGASGDQRRALLALLDRAGLSETVRTELVAAAERGIASRSDRQAVLDRVATVGPSDG